MSSVTAEQVWSVLAIVVVLLGIWQYRSQAEPQTPLPPGHARISEFHLAQRKQASARTTRIRKNIPFERFRMVHFVVHGETGEDLIAHRVAFELMMRGIAAQLWVMRDYRETPPSAPAMFRDVEDVIAPRVQYSTITLQPYMLEIGSYQQFSRFVPTRAYGSKPWSPFFAGYRRWVHRLGVLDEEFDEAISLIRTLNIDLSEPHPPS